MVFGDACKRKDTVDMPYYRLEVMSPSTGFWVDDADVVAPPFDLFRLKSSMTVFILIDSAALVLLQFSQLTQLTTVNDPTPQFRLDFSPASPQEGRGKG